MSDNGRSVESAGQLVESIIVTNAGRDQGPATPAAGPCAEQVPGVASGKTLVIGLGNPLISDDSVGLADRRNTSRPGWQIARMWMSRKTIGVGCD